MQQDLLKTVMYRGKPRNVPWDIEWLSTDADGEITGFVEEPVRTSLCSRFGYWAPVKHTRFVVVEPPSRVKFDQWESSLLFVGDQKEITPDVPEFKEQVAV